MRYPDQFAYKFEIEETIADVEIPYQFIIQPHRKYFVHGIDYSTTRQCYPRSMPTKGEKNYCIVVDNGKGITANRLEEIRERLNQY